MQRKPDDQRGRRDRPTDATTGVEGDAVIQRDYSWLDDALRESTTLPPSSIHTGRSRRATRPESVRFHQLVVTAEEFREIGKIALKLQQQHDQVQRTREVVLLVRDQTMYEVISAFDNARFLQESQGALRRTLNDIFQRYPHDADVKKLQDLLHQSSNDLEAFDRQSTRVDPLEEKLRALEDSMQRYEDRCSALTTSMLEKLASLGLYEATASPTPEYSPGLHSHDSSATDLHPTVATLYERIANVKIMRDRMVQLLAEQAEERSRRLLKEDQGLMPEISNSSFEENCRAELSKAEQAIRDALEAKEAASVACDREGTRGLVDEKLVQDAMLEFAETSMGSDEHRALETPSPPVLVPVEQRLSWFFNESRSLPTLLTAATGALDSAIPTPKISRNDLINAERRVKNWIKEVSTVDLDPAELNMSEIGNDGVDRGVQGDSVGVKTPGHMSPEQDQLDSHEPQGTDRSNYAEHESDVLPTAGSERQSRPDTS